MFTNIQHEYKLGNYCLSVAQSLTPLSKEEPMLQQENHIHYGTAVHKVDSFHKQDHQPSGQIREDVNSPWRADEQKR